MRIEMQRSAKLVDDATYITAHETLSKKPFEYYTAFPPVLHVKTFHRQCTPYAGGCKQNYVTSENVEEYNQLLNSGSTSTLNRVPNSRPSTNTELFGTAPYKALGDGLLRAPDVYSKLVGSGFNPHCAKTLGEKDYDRFECMAAPLAVEDERVTGPRGGAGTRVGPAYYAC